MPKIIPLCKSCDRGFSDEPVVELDYDYEDEKIQIKIRYFFPGFSISENKCKILEDNQIMWRRFKEVKMSGIGFLSKDKEPLLPSFGRFVQIPPGYVVANEKFDRYNRVYFKKKLMVKWAEESVKDMGEVEFNENIYKNNRMYFPIKTDVVKINGPYYMDGYKAILVQVRPMQYNPHRGMLRGYGKIIVSIGLLPDEKIKNDEISRECALTNSIDNLEGFGNLLFNPSRKLFQQKKISRTLNETIPTEHKKTEFLIIYPDDELKEPAEKLKKWKNKRGLVTNAVSAKEIIWKNIDEEKIGDKEEIKKAKIEKLKKYIRDIRLVPFSHLRYILLFGDVGKIPLSQEPSHDDDESIKNTDHYFFTHEDPVDSECLLPCVSGGRIPVEKMKDGMSVVDQIISYEKKPPCDSEYYKRITVAAEFDDKRSGLYKKIPLQGKRAELPAGFLNALLLDGKKKYTYISKQIQDGRAEQNFLKTMEDIRRHMICKGFEVNRVYFSEAEEIKQFRDGTPVPQEVKSHIISDENKTQLLIDYINEGQLIVAYRGHGYQDGWKHPKFKVDNLNSICGSTSIFFSVNCSTGRFHDSGQDSFSEQILALNGGAPSLIAANDLSYRWRNDSMVKALFDAIWPGIIPAFPKTNASYPIKNHRLGDILNYAKAYVLVKHGANPCTKEQFEMFHIIGDPTLEIWGDEPLRWSERQHNE